MKTVLTALLVSFLLHLLPAQGLTDKCALGLRKAQLAADKGNTRQAFKLLNRVDKRCPNDNQVALAGCNIAQQLGLPKKAYAFVAKVKAQGAVSDTARVKLAIWRGMYAFELGLRYHATRNLLDAKHKLRLYDINDPKLYSIVNNNLGVAYVFNQSLNRQPKVKPPKPVRTRRAKADEATEQPTPQPVRNRVDTLQQPKGEHHTKIHLRDFHKAARLFEEAIQQDPDNCPARQNLRLCQSVMSVYDTASTMGYITYDQLQRLDFPVDTCALAPLDGGVETNQRTVTVLSRELAKSDEVVLLMDVSGSMELDLPTGGSRFAEMIQAASEVVSLLDTTQLVGGLTIGGDCGEVPQLEYAVTKGQHLELADAIRRLETNGKTPLDQRLIQSFALFSSKKRRQKTILLFTDGVGNCGRANLCALAGEMAKRRIRLVVYALLLENDENAQAYANYACLVAANGGSIYGTSSTQTIEDRTYRIDDRPFSIQMDQAAINAGVLDGVLSRQFRNDGDP